MKFVSIAQTFTAFAVVTNVSAAHERNNLRKLSFLEAKPAEEGCMDGEYRCACRDGTRCNYTFQCSDLGVSGSCSPRQPNRETGLSCRNGENCIMGNTACADGSKCKERNGEFAEVYRNLIEGDGELIEAKPASEACQKGDLRCTCRDGTTCRRTQQCVNRNVSGSCSYRPPNRNSNKSCRNGESCINNNTACRDGSKCKERDGFLSFNRNLDKSEDVVVNAKPEDERCADGTWDCTCRDGSSCKKTDQCTDRGVGGSCDKRVGSADKSAKLSCRNGNSCIDNNTACEDGSKCKERNGFLDLIDESEDVFVEAKPEDERCTNGTWSCTCRDGSSCKKTTQCTDRGVGGSCDRRVPNRNSNMSCRNGESCINNNTACRDGSKCKERNGFLASA